MRYLVIIIGLLTILLIGCSQTIVIDYPEVESSNSDLLEFHKIEMTDSTIIFYGNLYNYPGESVNISSSSILKGRTTGKTYRLVRATGIELDKNEVIKQSWNRQFSLQFEPVDPKDKVVDFYETLSEGDGYQIEGILLKEKTKKGLLCHIEGEVIDNTSYSRLVLVPEGKDIRTNKWISIPVCNGKFSYNLYVKHPTRYELYAWSDKMNGAWRSTSFFADKGKVLFKLYHINKETEWTSDIHINQEYQHFKQIIEDKFITPLQEESIEMEVSGKAYTPEYSSFREKSKKVMDERLAFTLDYVKLNPSIIGLSLLKDLTKQIQLSNQISPKNIIDTYNKVYANKFPYDNADSYIQNWILSQSINVGDTYIDFTAPDTKGIVHKISDEIKGKVALIDLWASWCGPCRRKSKSMIPLYEKYKDKGFIIVGVARESSQKDMEVAIEKDGYPWLCLLELNDIGKIWEKYGVGNGGGAIIMVNKDGKILAINPTAKEIDEILKRIL